MSKKVGLFFVLYSAVTFLHNGLGVTWIALPALPLAVIGGALGVFLAFRNNSAYDRWWEARSLWGGLVNTARTASRQALTLVDDSAAANRIAISKQEFVELQIAYVHALRCHLRRQNPFPEMQRHLPADFIEHLREQRNVPVAILMEMAKFLRRYFDAGQLDSFRWMAIDRTLTDLCNLQGSCERIKNTPLPRQYHYFPRLLVTVYAMLLPLGLVEGLGLSTPVVSSVVYFIFASLDTIGREIENPFENTVHDTPMSSLTRSIEINLRQNLGDDRLPDELRPVDGFVY